MPHILPKVRGAMFDVRPVDATGQVSVERVNGVLRRLNLRHKQPDRSFDVVTDKVAKNTDQIVAFCGTPSDSTSPALPPPPIDLRESTLRRLQGEIDSGIDAAAVFCGLGGVVHSGIGSRPRYRKIIISRSEIENRKHGDILREMHRPLSDEAQIVERNRDNGVVTVSEKLPETVADIAADDRLISQLRDFGYGHPKSRPLPNVRSLTNSLSGSLPGGAQTLIAKSVIPMGDFKLRQPLSFVSAVSSGANWRARLITAGMVVVAIFGGVFFLKNNIIGHGNVAVQNLQAAKSDLEHFDFQAAALNFTSAYEQFSRAESSVNLFGVSFGNIIAGLPGGKTYKSARDLVEAGKLIAGAGKAMADVVATLSKSGKILDPQSDARVLMGEIIKPLKAALALSESNMDKAGQLLATIDAGVIPEEKKQVLDNFKEKIPELRQLLAKSVEYVDFLEALVSSSEQKRYLLLFENASELRPTGGFPGTYGVVTFNYGRLTDFFADDVYNLDGQLKEKIIPPWPLQHITPNWAMRDAGWFIDFPSSAIKISSFFERESGYAIDGVIAINPAAVSKIVDAVGPVSMPQYGVTITGDNLLSALQKEVEYGDGKKTNKPKQIVSDLAPILLERLYRADKAKWSDIFNILFAGMERKDILMYFRDVKLEQFAIRNGFGGQVVEADADYLMVAVSNIKGSKADAVTDTAVKLETAMSHNEVVHKLEITRQHDGGSNQYGFYNRQNSAYIRILVPKGARLVGVSGNSRPGYKPLIDYDKSAFTADADLVSLESSARTSVVPGVDVFEESGKTEFGFWMNVDPGKTKTVEVEYAVLASRIIQDGAYKLYIQKQPGLVVKNLNLAFNFRDYGHIVGSSVNFKESSGTYIYNAPLERDLPVVIQLTQ